MRIATTDKLVKGSGTTAKQYDPNAGEAGAEIYGRESTTGEPLPLKVTNSGGLGVLNVTGGGGGTEYAEDTAHVSGDLGTQVLAVRNDAGTALAGTDGDYIPLSTDNTGALRVTGGGAGTQYTEGDTDATITGTAVMMEGAGDTLVPAQGTVADGLLVNLGANNDITGTVTANAGTNLNTSALALESGNIATAASNLSNINLAMGTDNDTTRTRHISIGGTFDDSGTIVAGGDDRILSMRITNNRALHTNLRNSSGTEVGTAASPLRIDPTGTTTQPISGTVAATQSGTWTVSSVATVGSITTSVTPGTAAANLGKAEDAAHASGDTGVMALGVRNDTLSTTFAGTSGDYSGIATDSLGAVWVRNVAYIDSGTTLTAINTTYNNTTTTASSADITIPTGSRMCDLIMTIDSTLAPTDITFHVEAKDGSTYFRMKNGFLGKFIFDDTAVATAQNIHTTFPCPMTGTMRVTVVATGTDATNTFDVTNAKLFFRS